MPAPFPGDRLKEARRRRGLTQEALAERANLSVGVIKKLERGGTGRLETYHVLARALKVRTSALLEPAGPHETRRSDDDNILEKPCSVPVSAYVTRHNVQSRTC
ncbi:helix-turn-helix domain-containing protein [Actinacidiphila oryziradicis]|uniref:Helix-turn-helix transcriptional regulator n=1 Tax=Actinacidiphila oryziradicis TaxID=2571141 RepID=A0A4U0RGB3_9ACTN|nr:helix-turn-helix transcriptional regulator [Actinacidiphila oryziradicis]TJZ94435.1 helix-turn-helix transcriptional regulator [Actinacidiphila oryziradicis]